MKEEKYPEECKIIDTIIMSEVKKTSKEWQDEIPKEHELVILDPDGWDRGNLEYSFNEELITSEEFYRRLCHSTIKCNSSFINIVK